MQKGRKSTSVWAIAYENLPDVQPTGVDLVIWPSQAGSTETVTVAHSGIAFSRGARQERESPNSHFTKKKKVLLFLQLNWLEA